VDLQSELLVERETAGTTTIPMETTRPFRVFLEWIILFMPRCRAPTLTVRNSPYPAIMRT